LLAFLQDFVNFKKERAKESAKKESKVICMREFEIILLQTQSLAIKPF
jgi:hypothetical protein